MRTLESNNAQVDMHRRVLTNMRLFLFSLLILPYCTMKVHLLTCDGNDAHCAKINV